MSELPVCFCAERYKAHHPECPARLAYERLDRLRVHCAHCGADYVQTGLEAGCPCKLRAEIKRLHKIICGLGTGELDRYHPDVLTIWLPTVPISAREGK